MLINHTVNHGPSAPCACEDIQCLLQTVKCVETAFHTTKKLSNTHFSSLTCFKVLWLWGGILPILVRGPAVSKKGPFFFNVPIKSSNSMEGESWA